MLGNGPVQFEKGVTEKVREEPRRYPTSFGEGWSKKGRLLILPGEPSVQASRRNHDTSSATYSTKGV